MGVMVRVMVRVEIMTGATLALELNFEVRVWV